MKSIELVLKFINDFQESPENEYIFDPEKISDLFLYAVEGIVNLENALQKYKYNLSIIGNDDGTVSLWKNYDYENMPGAESLLGEIAPDVS